MDPIAFSRPYCFEEEAEAAAEAVRSGWIVGGPRLKEFEARFASQCSAAQAVGVSSWTAGGFLVLHALGIGPGDEVIVPSYTFIASVNVIVHAGAVPVFADIDPYTWNVNPADVAAKITPRTKAIMPVDQIGLPCDMDAINGLARAHGLAVIDDAACAFGSRNRNRPVGSLTDVTVFSLHARKVITTGEGGMIVTDDGELAARLRRLRHQGMSLSDFERHGMAPTTFESYPEIGYNFRITDIQAGMGLRQLDRLDDILTKRAAIAARYTRYLADHPLFRAPGVPEGITPNWQSYMAGVKAGAGIERDDVMTRLHERGVPTRRSVMASHLEAPYQGSGAVLPHTEFAFRQNFLLPLHPALTGEQQDYILRALDEITQGVT